MKSVFVPIDDPDISRPIFDAAIQFARRHGSYVEGAATLPVLDNYIVGEMVPLWPPQQRSMGDIARDAREAFVNAVGRADIPVHTGLDQGASHGWHEAPLLGDGAVAARARIFDITVVGRPSSSASGPRLSLLETIVFESGRPLLIAPPDYAGAPIGDTVLIAWNHSTETARCIGLGLDLLKQAKVVHVLTVEGVSSVPGPSGADLTRMLRLDGVNAEEMTLPAKGKTMGEVITQQCEAVGADLLIKGAYTQSRLRQMIFGGATSHVLAQARLPVFMAH